MQWETPSFVEMSMDAEIGAYQNDFNAGEKSIRARQGSESGEEARSPENVDS